MARSPVKVLFYAINGTGLGHVSRLLAVARSARELVQAVGARPDFQFLTTSDGSEVIFDFPVFKVPSKSTAVKSGTARADFVAQSKLLISNVVAQFRPNVLVMDTVPQGAHQEFAFLKAYARTCLLIDRHKDTSVAQSDVVQKHMMLYDRILVPDWQEERERYPAPASVLERRRFVGPIHGFRPARTLSRQAVRQYFSVEAGRRLVYVSAGGGGDDHAPEELSAIVDALAQDDSLHLLVGYGPLFRGPRVYRSNVTPVGEPDIWRFFSGIDAAVSAAGYNTYQELLAARVPTLFFAQQKGMDRQDERILRGAEAGYHEVFDRSSSAFALSQADPMFIRQKTLELLDGVTREHLRQSLESRRPSDGALRAATELLALESTLPDSSLDRRDLHEVAALRRASANADDFESSARTYLDWRALASSPAAIENTRDRAVQSWLGDEETNLREAREAVAWGSTLDAHQQNSGFDGESWWDFLKSFCADGSITTEPQRRARLGDALDAIAERFGSDFGPAIERIQAAVKRTELSQSLSRVAAELDAQPDADADEVLSDVVG